MKISQLQILNFKSYLGHHIIGPFHQHFTCIIGPNGNGKSNILDAMLFVFGFKSSKLRQDTLASLIHSSAYGQPDQAKVTVKFIETKTVHQKEQNFPHKIKAVTITESMSVSRTIRRNGYSFYQLNDKKIQWQQLKDFLMKKDIDLEKNLFIILQGEVERLCQLSPEKLVQYLEYVSGSDQYVPKITQLQSEYVLEGVNFENAKQKYQISKKVFTQQQKQTFQLLEHIGLRIKLLELSLLYTKKSKLIQSKNLIKNQQQIKQISEEINQINASLKLLLTTKSNFEKELSQNQTLINQFEKQISDYTKQMTQLESVQKRKKQTELEYLIKDLQQKQKQTEFVEKEKRQLNKISQNEKELKQQSKQMEQLIVKVLEMIAETSENKVLNEKTLSFNKKSNKKGPLSHKTFLQLNSIIKLKKQTQSIRVLISTQICKELNEQQAKLHQVETKHQKVVEKYGQNGEKFTSNEQVTAKLKLRIRNYTEALQQKQKQMSASMSNLQQIKRRIKDCESTKTALSNHQKVLNQIKSANLAKILLPHTQITTLSQQIILPPDLTSIISAITPQLDFVIVQNHEQARQIIQFLNSRKIGRMSFILKDQVNKLMNGVNIEWKRGSVPKTCERIYDMARPIDKQYEKIWFWSVGNTLIADTLEDAMKVAYYETSHYRVITKNGEFIDMSGAMTKLSIQAKSSESEDKFLLETRMKILQNKLDEDLRKISVAKKQKQQLSEELNQLSLSILQFSNISQLKQHIQATQQEIASISKALLKIKGQKANHQLTIRLREKELEKIVASVKFDKKKCRITFDELMELVEEYETVLGKIKKISISEQIIKVHEEKLQKYRAEMYLIDSKILAHKSDIEQILEIIKNKQQKINLIQTKRKNLRNHSSQIQQKLFLLDLDIKQAKGETNNEGNSSHKPIFFKEQARNPQSKHKKKIVSQYINGGRQIESNSQIQSLTTQKNNLPQLINQQKALNHQITKTINEIKLLDQFNSTQLNTLSRLFSFLVDKCQQGQIEIQLEKQKLNQHQKNKISSQNSGSSSKKKSSKRKIQNENSKEQTFEQLLESKHKKFIKFKEILFEYFESQNLVSTLQKTVNPKQQLSQSKSVGYLLTNLCNHCYQNDLAPLSKIISLCYFNSWKIMNIGPEDEYFFVSFLSKDQIHTLTKDVTPKKQSQSSESSGKSIQSSEAQVQTQGTLEEGQRMDLFLLEHLSLQRMRFLYKLYEQKLQALEKNSRSMFMKSGKKQNPHVARFSSNKRISQTIGQPIDPEDPSMTNPLSFFSDPEFPLDPNELEMINQYITQKKRFLQLQSYLQSVENGLQTIYKQLLCLRQTRNSCFLNTFNLINIQVNKIYNYLTKGSAEINLVNSINPLEGLEFSVRPFNKSWKSVNLLSGGQKTLTSLSLIFACEQVRKFPFYFMDEIDAALDFKNVTNLGKYIKEKQQVQHIVISLRKNMYEQCNSLVCIYKVNDVSRTMKVDMRDLYGIDRKGKETKNMLMTNNRLQENKKGKKDENGNKDPVLGKEKILQNRAEEPSQTSTLTVESK